MEGEKEKTSKRLCEGEESDEDKQGREAGLRGVRETTSS